MDVAWTVPRSQYYLHTALSFSDFRGLPCGTFYNKSTHNITSTSADRPLEKTTTSRNMSGVGESEDDDVCHEESFPEPWAKQYQENEDYSESLKGIPPPGNVQWKFQWKRKHYFPPSDTEFCDVPDRLSEPDEGYTRLTSFSKHQQDSIFKVIPEQANHHSVQTTLLNADTTAEEITKLFGRHVLMGVVALPRVRLYWDPSMTVPLICDTMTEKRFLKLRNNLHVVAEDSNQGSSDRLWKVRPFLHQIRTAV